jgi:hypothetical protein
MKGRHVYELEKTLGTKAQFHRLREPARGSIVKCNSPIVVVRSWKGIKILVLVISQEYEFRLSSPVGFIERQCCNLTI